jgi:hypothetical protein|tara:strand:- start:13292 stop:13579 length:288 start_codon:yes stop_codon:yes gene_type:complete
MIEHRPITTYTSLDGRETDNKVECSAWDRERVKAVIEEMDIFAKLADHMEDEDTSYIWDGSTQTTREMFMDLVEQYMYHVLLDEQKERIKDDTTK